MFYIEVFNLFELIFVKGDLCLDSSFLQVDV